MATTIIQTNANRSRGAHDLMFKTAMEAGAEIVIISEPNKKMAKERGWLMDEREDVAIWVRGRKKEKNKKIGYGFISLEYKQIRIFGCYISPNIAKEEVEDLLFELGREVRSVKEEVIIGGDFNAKSEAWGATNEDARGKMVGEWMASLGLEAVNKGGVPTCKKGRGSHIDITMGRGRDLENFTGWEVSMEENLSDHRDILIKYKTSEVRKGFRPTNRWILDKRSMEAFMGGMRDRINRGGGKELRRSVAE